MPRASRARRGCSAPRPGRHADGRPGASSATGSPPTAPRSSIVGPASEERRARAEAIAAERGLELIPPYDDDRVIAGQGTIGLELVEDLPDLAAVLVPIGGGGLASGIAAAIRRLRPERRIIGVEPELAADARDSLARGPRSSTGPPSASARTIADGTRTQALGRRTFAHLRGLPRRRS